MYIQTYRVIALRGEGESFRSPHPGPSISQTLAPGRLASVCGRVECLPRGFSCLNPGVPDLRTSNGSRSTLRSYPEAETRNTQRALDPSTPSILPFDLQVRRCLPPTVFSFEEVAPGKKIYLLGRYLLPVLRSTRMTHLSRCSDRSSATI